MSLLCSTRSLDRENSTFGQTEVDQLLIELLVCHLEHHRVVQDEVERGDHCVHLVRVEPSPAQQFEGFGALNGTHATISVPSR